jgi:Glyoxalase-like domain
VPALYHIQMTGTSPPATRLDHLVVVAPTLEAGAAWVRAALGADPRPGGRHDRMGTHNLLLRLGPVAYLEVIAIDPAAPPPGRPRWFGFDTLVPDAEPRLAAWVARTDDVAVAAAASPEPLGAVEPMTRGDLRWRLTVPPDGTLPLGGAGPLLIQWDTGPHPAERLPDDGCELVGLTITHPDPERVGRLLAAIGFAGPVAVVGGEAVKLTAEIRTQSGVRRL